MKKHQKRARPHQQKRKKTQKQIERSARLKRERYDALVERDRKREHRRTVIATAENKIIYS